MLGQRVYEAIIETKSNTLINLNHLNKGTYFITFDNGFSTIQKTVIIN